MKHNLIELTRNNDIEGVKKAIAEGADLNLQDEWGWTALMVAICYEKKEIAELLIKRGVNLDLKDKDGWTALMKVCMMACNRNQYEMAKLLVEAGANLDIQDKWGWTALMEAKGFNNYKIIKLLVENGANLDIQNKWGWTALMHANYTITKLLIKAGANKDIKDNEGKTALDYAKEDFSEKIIQLLTPKKVDLLPVKCDEEIVSYRYVKLPKYIAKRPWYSKPNSLMLYIHLLLNKSYLDRTLINNIPLLKNQLLTSNDALTKALKLTTKEIRTALKHLQETNDIEIKTTPKYSIITLLFEELFDEKSKYKEKENLPLADIINKIAKLLDNDDIEIEIVGSWLWISGDSKQYKNEIKEAGFKFSNAKKMWFYSCKTEYKAIKSNIDIDKIRLKYGSEILKNKSQLKKWFLNVK